MITNISFSFTCARTSRSPACSRPRVLFPSVAPLVQTNETRISSDATQCRSRSVRAGHGEGAEMKS
jgi:hypothetical protein